MFILIFTLTAFATVGMGSFIRYTYDRYTLRNTSNVPTIFISTISKHSNYSSDERVAKSILESYKNVFEYRRELTSHSKSVGNKYVSEIKILNSLLRRHKTLARKYRATLALPEDKSFVEAKLEEIGEEVSSIENLTNTNTDSLREKQKTVTVDTVKNSEASNIHRENLRKCDIIRLYNHKAIPLKDLSTSLIDILDNLKGKQGMEDSKQDILNQLKELSIVIDDSLESLPTYDSKSYVCKEQDRN